MKRSLLLSPLAMVLLLLAATVPAHAQATRTWVSGVGDDANPCSRTAPCKTFAGAISKTASGGEINVLDPGGFGGVTITKPITISSEGFEAGVLVSGTNGIIVNVPNATDQVVLRGLDIEGLGTGLSGITVLTGGTVQVENCTINRFTTSGINFTPTVANSQLHVFNTIIRGVGTQAVLISSAAAVKASLENVRAIANNLGFRVLGSGTVGVSIKNSNASGNTNAGYAVANANASMTIENSVASGNGTGIVNGGGTVRLGNMSITGNPTAISGACLTFKNNDIDLAVSCTLVNPQ